MPWKMVLFLIVLVILGVFAAFNLENRSDISLGFVVFESVPVFLSLLLAFVAGALFTMPFFAGSRRRQRRKLAESGRGYGDIRGERLPGQEPADEHDPLDRKP